MTMLRRKPTSITLTSEDVAAYEDSLTQQRARAENERAAARARPSPGKDGSTKIDPNDELKPLPGDRARVARGATAGGGAASSAAEREARIMGR